MSERCNGDGEGTGAGADFEDMRRGEAFDFAGDGARDIFVDQEVLAEAFGIMKSIFFW